MTVFAPFIGQVGRIEPYLSLDELKFSATASDIDFTNLVENGAQTAQDRALYELIVRASGKVDAYCMGRLGTLNATENTESGRYAASRDGTIKIKPSYSPIIAVSGFQYGQLMGELYDMALSSNNCWIERDEMIFQAQGAASVNAVSGMQALSYIVNRSTTGMFYCQWTYVNGYPNTFTESASAAGATSLVVTDATGIYPGTSLTVWDGMNDEFVTISGTYVSGSTTLPLTTALKYAHGVGVNVSQMHTNVKQATIHFVVGMVKERGQGGGFEISPAGEVTPSTTGKGKGFSDDEIQAYDLLDEFKVIWGQI